MSMKNKPSNDELANLSTKYMMEQNEWTYQIRNSYRDGYADGFEAGFKKRGQKDKDIIELHAKHQTVKGRPMVVFVLEKAIEDLGTLDQPEVNS